MYIKKVEIKNIRSISEFTMEFPEGKEAGWHVLIGDNGAGKSSIIRSLSAVLIGQDEIGVVRPFWDEWLSGYADHGEIKVNLIYDNQFDPFHRKNTAWEGLSLNRKSRVVPEFKHTFLNQALLRVRKGERIEGAFSAAYGPFRRFTGGNPEWYRVFNSSPIAGSHLSVFGEDVALTEAMEWLKELDRRRLKEKEAFGEDDSPSYGIRVKESEIIFNGLKTFINQSGLLPHNSTLEGINKEGEPIFKDGNGNVVKLTQLSDGFRSILSLTFELIRQLVLAYSGSYTFLGFNETNCTFRLPGVVLIDEIDAHLHPTWQTRIGQWFTEYFPKLQFIVTTHSPLICRACENGSIWRLAAPGNDQESGELTGEAKDKLVYGDILDAYDTDVFGPKITRGDEGREKQKEYRNLVYKENYGLKLTAEEKKQLKYLKSIFHTNVAVEE